VVSIALCCSCVGQSALAFAPLPETLQSFQKVVPFSSATTRTTGRSSIFSTSAPTEFPPLSEDTIRKFLDAIPVYAVVDPAKEAIVLLADKGESFNSLAYLSFSASQINELYAPILRAQQQQQQQQQASVTTWEITAFPLGLVWFDLLKNPIDREAWVVDTVEYRLLASAQQLNEARNILQQQAAKNGVETDMYFQKGYNEIPLFIDDFLRVQPDQDGKSLIPIYFGLKDLLETCQRAVVDASQERYQAHVNLSDLRKIIQQMQEASPTNFEQAVLIPHSVPLEYSPSEYQIPTIPSDAQSKSDEIVEVPVINQWDD
jgi:hypothetical protein